MVFTVPQFFGIVRTRSPLNSKFEFFKSFLQETQSVTLALDL